MRISLGALLAGAAYPIRALWLVLRTPRLWVYLGAPALLNLVILVVLAVTMVPPALRWIDDVLRALPPWAGSVTFVVRIVLSVALLLVLGFVMLQFGAVVGAPWYERLSVRVEETVTGQVPPDDPLTWRSVIRDVSRALLFQLKKLLVLIAIAVPVFVMGLLPLIGPLISGVGGVLLGSLLIFLDMLDPPLERRRLAFREKVATFTKTFPASLGMGAVCLFLLGIPLLNLAFVPLCVVAGTMYYGERVAGEREHEFSMPPVAAP